ncbi:MAG: DMT family transporter [Candidatus Dasytiphilus stammeri]
MKINTRKKIKIICLFMSVALIWGSTWMAMKLAVQTVPPMFATGLRFLCASPLLLWLSWRNGQPLLVPSAQRNFQYVIGLCYFIIPFTLMFYGQQYTSASLASIIFATMPAAVLIASIIILQNKTSCQQICGLLISIFCLTEILLQENNNSVPNSGKGTISLIIAVIMHAVMYVIFKKRGGAQPIPILTYNTFPCLAAGILLTLIGLYIEQPVVSNISLSSSLSLLYLGIASNGFGMLCYFSLQQLTRPFQASLVFLIFPLISIILESIWTGLSINCKTVLLLFPLTAGIFMTLSYSNSRSDQRSSSG